MISMVARPMPGGSSQAVERQSGPSGCGSAPVPGAWHWGTDWDEALRLAAEVIELRLRHGYVVK